MIRIIKILSPFNLFLLCVNVLFAIPVYAVLINNIIGVRIPGHSILVSYVPTVLYMFMVCLGIKELDKAKYYSDIINRLNVRNGIKIYFIICLVMSVQIPWNLLHANYAKTVINDSVVWLLPVIFVFGLKEENWNAMLKIFCWHTAIGCIVFFIAMPVIMREVMMSDPLRERLDLQKIGGSVLKDSGQLLYAHGILLLSFGSINTFWRATALTAMGLSIWISLIGQFRNVIIGVFLIVAIGILYIPMRAAGVNKAKRYWKLIAPVLFVLLLFIAVGNTPAISDNLHTRYPIIFDLMEALQGRIEYVFSDSGSASGINLRIEETRQALSEQNSMQLLLGKGMGATWSGGTLYGEQRGMLHLGLGHLLQRGGVPLAMFVLVFPFGIGIYLLFRSRSQLVLSCAGLIAIAFVYLFVANIFELNLGYMVLLLCSGGCLLHFHKKAAPGY